jgi:hypothetical protein
VRADSNGKLLFMKQAIIAVFLLLVGHSLIPRSPAASRKVSCLRAHEPPPVELARRAPDSLRSAHDAATDRDEHSIAELSTCTSRRAEIGVRPHGQQWLTLAEQNAAMGDVSVT